MYYNENIENIYEKLNSSEEGLSKEEVNKRLEQDGKNVLPRKKMPSLFMLFLKEFSSPIEIILIITIIISLLVGEIVDALVITFIILVDAVMGTYHEYKALKSVESLNKMIRSVVKVIRDDKESLIDSENIVVGDIVLLKSGDRINADCRIIECSNLQIDESVLTGESASVYKNNDMIQGNVILAERKNMLFAGCNVITGRCKAIVVETGLNTEIGKIYKEVSETEEEKTPLTIRIEKFSKQISILIIVIAIISSIILMINGYKFDSIFLSVVALAISAMPEGLPLALTMALTIASNKMSKKNVVVKNLNAVEALGSCSVIATDKTGTLTVNEQTAKKIILSDGKEYEVTGTGYNTDGEVLPKEENSNLTKIINLCSLNNEARFYKKQDKYEYYGDSIDIAFLALKNKYNSEKINYKIVKRVPYESEKQYSALFYEEDGKLKCTVKGSIEAVLKFSRKKDLYLKQNESLSNDGYRVIAVCDGYVDEIDESNIKNLDFLGMVAFIDPVRKEVKDSINECKNAGIKVVMVTGDHPRTALSIAKELGLADSDDSVITGSEIEELLKESDSKFDKAIKDKKVFSRVSPLQKLRIVESFKRMGEFVAVTGDGVNDAPAIKTANIGIAMGSGTDVSKDTADMIIADDNFSSIVEGVKEGRIAYFNIRKIILFLLSCGMAEVIFYLLAVSLGYELPLVAIQLLWLNIVTDGLQDIALSFENGTDEIMKIKPRKTKENIFSLDLGIEVFIYGLTIALIIISIWKYLIDKNTQLVVARSIIMITMVFIQNIHVLNCRSEKNSVFKTSILSNKLLLITITGSILLQIIVTKIDFLARFLKITSLPFNIIALYFIISTIIIIVAEIYKTFYRTILKKNTFN